MKVNQKQSLQAQENKEGSLYLVVTIIYLPWSLPFRIFRSHCETFWGEELSKKYNLR